MEVEYNPKYSNEIRKGAEVWASLDHIGYPKYKISSSGVVRKTYDNKNDRILKPSLNTYGYLTIDVFNDKGERKAFKLHRLLALTFLLNPLGHPTVDHMDRNKLNNTIYPQCNLRWSSHSDQNKNKNKVILQPNSRRLFQMDMEGKVIKEWENLQEMLKQNPTFKLDGISHACLGRSRSAYGFKWAYKTEGDSMKWKCLLTDHQLNLEVSKEGDIRTPKWKKESKGTFSKPRNQYIWTNHGKSGKSQYYVKELVSMAFLGWTEDDPRKPYHLDGDRKNNALSNIELRNPSLAKGKDKRRRKTPLGFRVVHQTNYQCEECQEIMVYAKALRHACT